LKRGLRQVTGRAKISGFKKNYGRRRTEGTIKGERSRDHQKKLGALIAGKLRREKPYQRKRGEKLLQKDLDGEKKLQ